MKKILYAIAIFAAVTSCDMFQLDNMDGPNAQVNGKLLDAMTGEKIGVETSQTASIDWSTWSYVYKADGGSIVVVEQGWDATQEQDWLVRYDGMYTNNLVFAADYVMSTKKLPCYEPDNTAFTLKKGKNRKNFSVVPYCRIIDPQFETKKDAFGNMTKLVATFKVELGDASKANTVANVAFCANTQMFVGCNYQNLAKNSGAKKKNVTPGTTVTLEIDMNDNLNEELFKYNRERYLRIAAMANGNGYNTGNYYNFSPTYKISADFSTIEEVVWDEAEW
ncbi:MAG: DUF3823 domain-containing protein [Bacteroidales bacterium]|nr:DUF3823 domain-containing protein [Bacteroidales bacterium]